jgi:hypothetical protein
MSLRARRAAIQCHSRFDRESDSRLHEDDIRLLRRIAPRNDIDHLIHVYFRYEYHLSRQIDHRRRKTTRY